MRDRESTQKKLVACTLRGTAGLILAVSGVLPWLFIPLQGRLSGLHCAVFSQAYPQLTIGLIMILCGTLTMLSCLPQIRRLSLTIAVIAIMVSLSFPLHLAINDVSRLIEVLGWARQEQAIGNFDRFLPSTSTIPITIVAEPSLFLLTDRVIFALQCTSVGPLVGIAGALLLLLCGLFERRFCDIPLPGRLPAMIAGILVPLLVLLPHLQSEITLTRGASQINRGNYSAALALMEGTVNEKGLMLLENVVVSQGAILFSLGTHDDSRTRIHQATEAMKRKDFQDARFQLDEARRSLPRLPEGLFHQLYSSLFIQWGLWLYRGGQTATAVDLWTEANRLLPEVPVFAYFLSRAYYDEGRFELAIVSGLRAFEAIDDPAVQARISANIADSYYRVQEFGQARMFYLQSLLLDRQNNLRAVLSLVGK